MITTVLRQIFASFKSVINTLDKIETLGEIYKIHKTHFVSMSQYSKETVNYGMPSAMSRSKTINSDQPN